MRSSADGGRRSFVDEGPRVRKQRFSLVFTTGGRPAEALGRPWQKGREAARRVVPRLCVAGSTPSAFPGTNERTADGGFLKGGRSFVPLPAAPMALCFGRRAGPPSGPGGYRAPVERPAGQAGPRSWCRTAHAAPPDPRSAPRQARLLRGYPGGGGRASFGVRGSGNLAPRVFSAGPFAGRFCPPI